MAARSEIQLLISRIPLRAARSRPETLGRRINHDAKGFEVRVRVCGTMVINRRTSADEGYWRSPDAVSNARRLFVRALMYSLLCGK